MAENKRDEKYELGLTINVQRFTVHDGPGIRTEIFLKGCPLRCLWCSNPESQVLHPQVGVGNGQGKTACIGCGRCLAVCPTQALKIENGVVAGVDYDKCIYCQECARQCPTGNIRAFGKWYSADSLMKIIEADRYYYDQSGGGVTISGGDPLVQWQFTQEILRRCKRKNIHTCMESELHCKQEILDEVLPYCDLIISDIKHMDSDVHKSFAGVGNELCLANLKHVVECGVPLILRTPIVPGYNDEESNIHATAKFIKEELGNKIVQLQLLPYRPLGEDKYEALGMDYPMKDIAAVDVKVYGPALKAVAEIFKQYDVPVEIGAENLTREMIKPIV